MAAANISYNFRQVRGHHQPRQHRLPPEHDLPQAACPASITLRALPAQKRCQTLFEANARCHLSFPAVTVATALAQANLLPEQAPVCFKEDPRCSSRKVPCFSILREPSQAHFCLNALSPRWTGNPSLVLLSNEVRALSRIAECCPKDLQT